MKKLIKAEDVRVCKKNREVIQLDAHTLITPGAKDLASELGVEIKYCKATEKAEEKASVNAGAKSGQQDGDCEKIERLVKEKLRGEAVSDAAVRRIVREVMGAVTAVQPKLPPIEKESDPGGLRLIRGGSVALERFDTGVVTDKVGIREILTTKECPNLATGFMEIERSSFDWTLGYDELSYITEGNLNITVNGKTYHGHAGDVFFIPKNTSVTFGSPDYGKFFFTAYPANWREL